MTVTHLIVTIYIDVRFTVLVLLLQRKSHAVIKASPCSLVPRTFQFETYTNGPSYIRIGQVKSGFDPPQYSYDYPSHQQQFS